MLAVTLDRERVRMAQVPAPRRTRGHALLQLLVGGICNTDIELKRGYYGFSGVPGHEFVAKVVAATNPALNGKRVVGEINVACERCAWCRRGLQRHCPTRTVLGIVRKPGAFAEYLTLPERNLFVVPDSVPTEHAVFTEPLAAACEILDQVPIEPGQPVAVLGDGKLGLLIAQCLCLHGAKVHLFGRHANKLKIAAGVGVETHRTAPKGQFPVTVEATGSAEGLRQAVAMTVPRGTVVMKSTVHGSVSLDTAPVIVNEISLIGSRCGRFAAALPLLASGKLALDTMISAEFPLRNAPAAFARAEERGVLKVLLRNS